MINIPHVWYADDVNMIFDYGCTPGHITQTIDGIGSQFARIGLKLNASKTMPICFKRNQLEHDIDGQCSNVKILGVTLDDRLTASRPVIQKCKQMSAEIFALSELEVDLDLFIADCDLLFNSVAVLKLLYASECRWP